MIKKFGAVWLAVEDLEKAIAFYRDKLGLEVKTQGEEEGYADFMLEGTEIALGTREFIEKTIGQPISTAGPRHLILAWGAVDNVDGLYKELKSKGVNFVLEPKTWPWGQRVAYFSDPDGHIWEISSWVKKE